MTRNKDQGRKMILSTCGEPQLLSFSSKYKTCLMHEISGNNLTVEASINICDFVVSGGTGKNKYLLTKYDIKLDIKQGDYKLRTEGNVFDERGFNCNLTKFANTDMENSTILTYC